MILCSEPWRTLRLCGRHSFPDSDFSPAKTPWREVPNKNSYLADLSFLPWRPFDVAQDMLCAFAGEYSYPIGSVNVNLLPLPTSLSTQILPPCSSTNFLASVNPRPVPSTLCA